MMLPCKTNKCLKYPSCVNKSNVRCDILCEYYMWLIHKNRHLANKAAKTWGNIHMVLPNLDTLDWGVKGPKVSLIEHHR